MTLPKGVPTSQHAFQVIVSGLNSDAQPQKTQPPEQILRTLIPTGNWGYEAALGVLLLLAPTLMQYSQSVTPQDLQDLLSGEALCH